jgi:hypothetical protein
MSDYPLEPGGIAAERASVCAEIVTGPLSSTEKPTSSP